MAITITLTSPISPVTANPDSSLWAYCSLSLDGAYLYRMQVYINNTLAHDQNGEFGEGSKVFYCINPGFDLIPNTEYTWYIKGWDAFDWYTSSTESFFTSTGSSPPTKAENPTPSDTDTFVDFSNLTLLWDDGGGADTYDIYMGPVGNLSLVSLDQADTSLVVDTGDVPWGQSIYWRVDSTNINGTTTGDVWSFSTVNINSVYLGSIGNFIVATADDGVFLSTDFGDNWSRKTPDAVETTDWIKGICSSDGTYIIVESSAHAIYRSANSGTSWAEITPADGDTFSVNKIATSDDGQFMVIVGGNTTDPTESCYLSVNYGADWTAIKPVAASVEWTDCDVSNDGTIIGVSTTSYLYFSFDSGATWTLQNLAATTEYWACLSVSGDGSTGLIANTNDNNEFSIGTKTEHYIEATWAETEITSAGRGLLDDTTTAAQQDTLGLGTADVPTFSGVNFLEVSELPDPAVEGEVIRLLSDSRLYFGKGV